MDKSPDASGPRATLVAMTALPLPPARLLSVAEYAALPEDTEVHFELQEGRLVTSPSPRPRHARRITRLIGQLLPQLPAGVELLSDIDVDLALVPPDAPGFVRRPDLFVVRTAAIERVEADGALLTAADVVLAVEVVSPGSRRTDTRVKHDEYADSGIAHYWVLDEDRGRTTLTACHLAGAFGYADAPPVTGTFTAAEPFPVRIDLDALG